MIVEVHDEYLAQRLIAQHRASGVDQHDEVWEGVYMMSPIAGIEHQLIVGELAAILVEVINRSGLGVAFPGVNVSDRREGWEHNYRCPDVAVFLNDTAAENCGAFWLGGPDFLVEVVSPGDQTYEKLPFYEAVGVREVLVIDRKPWALMLCRREGDKLVESGRSMLDSSVLLTSDVVGLSFRLLPGPTRPQIEVTHIASGQRWVV